MQDRVVRILEERVEVFLEPAFELVLVVRDIADRLSENSDSIEDDNHAQQRVSDLHGLLDYQPACH
jgi:hypothetical protein